MLIVTIIFRNFILVGLMSDIGLSLSSVIRKVCLTTILTTAGLSLDLKAIYANISTILRLAAVPQFVEAMSIMVMAH